MNADLSTRLFARSSVIHPAIFSMALWLVPSGAHAQLNGLLGGVASVFGQVTNSVGGKLMASSQAVDLQAEREKFFASFDAQSAGMPASSKKQLLATMEATWQSAESAYLIENMRVQQAKDAPWVDFKKVAVDAVGGAAAQASMTSAFGSVGLADVMKSAAMDGVVVGVGGRPGAAVSQVPRAAVAAEGTSFGVAAKAGVEAGATDVASKTVTSAVGSAVGGLVRKLGFGGVTASAGFEVSDAVNPLVFLGKHPSELLAKDLYRENGFQGWKRIEMSEKLGADIYAPIAGEHPSRAAVFNYDKTGAVIGAFRVLNAPINEFSSVVSALSKQLNEPARYASTASALRAVWSSGAFASADASKISVGWSQAVPRLHAKAPVTVQEESAKADAAN